VAVTVPLGTPAYDADVRGADTPLASHRRQIEVYRAMEPARRVELVRRLRLGDQLFGRVWPDAPLVAP
jgi:hypothetical protein